jgi:uncharacterized surface protein with fasciclin (FAS1) repeats
VISKKDNQQGLSMIHFYTLWVSFILFFATTQGFSQIPAAPPANQPASQHVIDRPELSTYKKAAESAKIIQLFQGTGPFTAFIPTNAAFEKLGKEKLDILLSQNNQDRLADILMYHVVPGKYLEKNLKSMKVRTIEGREITIQVNNGEIRVNGAKVVKTDLIGPNGVVHEIDTVLIPD